MKKNTLSKHSDSELVNLFRTHAQHHTIHLREGKSIKANKEAEHAIEIVDELTARGTSSLLMLRSLLKDDNPEIRSWAATQLWSIAPIEAANVMREIAFNQTGLIQFEAQQFLKQKKLI